VGRPVPTPHVQRVPVGDLEIAVRIWEHPTAPTVVLLHGNGAHAGWWGPILPHLTSVWRTVTLDLRGHGESGWADPPRYGLLDYVADVAAVLRALGTAPVALVGHSMGGRIAVQLAARGPGLVRAIGMLDTRLDPVDPRLAARYRGQMAGRRLGRTYATREAAVAAFRFVPDEPDVDPAVVRDLATYAVTERAPGEWMFRFDRGVLTVDGDQAGDLHRHLAALGCPVFVGAGEASGVLGRRERALVRRLVPQAQVEVFPGAHHFLLHCPARVGAALRAFLDAHARNG
jgi:pimeloyl-ACP methyl ester carboxylesterase